MIAERPIHHLLRLTLEATSAHGIHSGRGDNLHDVLLLRDGNGLPAIPGSSLAGVLRHAYAHQHNDAEADALFGLTLNTPATSAHPSWLSVDWGLVHDSRDMPHEGLLDPEIVRGDALLSYLQQDKPLVRQRVRLNHRGAAEDTGKFDQTLIPAGVRYSHWLGYWCDGSEASMQRWQSLLHLLAEDSLRLGHGTRSGTGAFRVHALHAGTWDLRDRAQADAWAKRPRRRGDAHTLAEHPLAVDKQTTLQVRLELKAEAGWRVGGGTCSLKTDVHDESTQKLLTPQHEPRVQWANGRGMLGEHTHLLPGSAIKGALRHRVAYHYRRLNKQWSDGNLQANGECPAVIELFGSAEDAHAQAGQLQFSDLHLDDIAQGQLKRLTHNRIDRFTGGVIRGALFTEEVLWQTPLTLTITVLNQRPVQARARQALQHALLDLAHGRLPLGAAGSRGLGSFTDITGKGPQWSDGGAWLGQAGGQQPEEAQP